MVSGSGGGVLLDSKISIFFEIVGPFWKIKRWSFDKTWRNRISTYVWLKASKIQMQLVDLKPIIQLQNYSLMPEICVKIMEILHFWLNQRDLSYQNILKERTSIFK